MRRLLREPLVHFLLLGLLLFVAHGLLSRGSEQEPGKITVTQARVESLAGIFERTWQRPPSDVELKGLIDGYVREEVLYREGLTLGLDRDDQVIRRRVAQKLEFIGDNSASAEPTETELQTYFDSNRDKFESEARFTFRHIYLDPNRRQESLAADIARMLEGLNRGGVDAETLGDTTLLPLSFEDAPANEVKAVLGDELLNALPELPARRWAGPVRSGFGMHLVYVSGRTEVSDAAFAKVRSLVKREWERDRRLKTSDEFYAQLLRRYIVDIVSPQLAMGGRQQGQP